MRALLAALLLWPAVAASDGLADEDLPELPDVQYVLLDGDVELYVVERPGTRYVAHVLQFGTGPADDVASRQGVGNVALWTLAAGAKGSDGMERAGEHVARYRAGVRDGRFTVRWVSRPAAALSLWEDLTAALRRPAMPEDWLTSIQRNLAATYIDRDADPADTAKRVWRRLALGDHPAARPDHGTPRTTGELTREDLVLRIQQFRARPMQAFLVGDGDSEGVEMPLNRRFKRLPKAFDIPERETPPLPAGAAIVLVHRTGLNQSYVVAGSAGNVGGDDPAALLALEELLGAGIWGRLDQRLRVSGGSTYGFSPSAEILGDLQHLSFGAWVEPATTVQAVTALKETLEAVVGDEPPTAAEVASAAAGLETTFLLQLSSNDGCAEALRRLGALGRDPADPGAWLRELRGLTAERVGDAARSLIDPAEFAIVVVGDATVLEEPLGTLGVDVRVIGR